MNKEICKVRIVHSGGYNMTLYKSPTKKIMIHEYYENINGKEYETIIWRAAFNIFLKNDSRTKYSIEVIYKTSIEHSAKLNKNKVSRKLLGTFLCNKKFENLKRSIQYTLCNTTKLLILNELMIKEVNVDFKQYQKKMQMKGNSMEDKNIISTGSPDREFVELKIYKDELVNYVEKNKLLSQKEFDTFKNTYFVNDMMDDIEDGMNEDLLGAVHDMIRDWIRHNRVDIYKKSSK